MISLLAEAAPAGGAALDQVAIATGGAAIATITLLWLVHGHRTGRVPILGRLAALSSRVSGLPGWAALPSGLAGGALSVALLGMYWDIALHIDNGRDEGPLANPAHYLILLGLYGVFAAGLLAMALPRPGERPGPASLRLTDDWHVPVGGALISACGAFALIGFPLDDVWHRLFGQDVTLWGPTHLMLIGGAGMTLVGLAVLLTEGMRAKRRHPPRRSTLSAVVYIRRLSLIGGFLIGLSTFQAEFDFGVPQYRAVFQPFLIALAAGVALVAARMWVGRGGAIGAALFFLVMRGGVAIIVGPVLGQTTPMQPLFLVEALCIEGAALFLIRRPLAFGAVGGALIGTVGFAAEYGWSQLVMPLPWTGDIVPEGILMALGGGVAGGVLGALVALGLRSELPRPSVARAAATMSAAVVAACVANGLITTEPRGGSVSVALTPAGGGEAHATVRVEPASMAGDPSWLTVTAWQGGGLVVEELERIGDGVFRTSSPVPVSGDWKSMVRLHEGRSILGSPIYLPADPGIPAPEVAAAPRFERPLVPDRDLLQRELKDDVPGWLWGVASSAVLACWLIFLTALAWGVARVGRAGVEPPADVPPAPVASTGPALPAGVA
jgi:hypothetical protein